MADNRLIAGDDIPPAAAVIEVNVRELSKLFNSMDPSPRNSGMWLRRAGGWSGLA